MPMWRAKNATEIIHVAIMAVHLQGAPTHRQTIVIGQALQAHQIQAMIPDSHLEVGILAEAVRKVPGILRLILVAVTQAQATNPMTNEFIQQNFVTPEIAKALKELGFNEPCVAFWDDEGLFQLCVQEVGVIRDLANSDAHPGYDRADMVYLEYSPDPDEVAAPLWQQAIAHLRKLGIRVLESPVFFSINRDPLFFVVNGNNVTEGLPISEAIQKAIDILKSQQSTH